MYRIYADDTLIYDSTLPDFKIGQGDVTLETDKAGSFVFSLYPDHPYYDRLVRMRTVITVYKSGRIIFRGRVLSDVTNYQNLKVVTCEGELNFLRDTICRPFERETSGLSLLEELINAHNAQVDDFKKFTIGIVDGIYWDTITRSSTEYAPTLDVMKAALTGTELGGHFVITHGDDGTDQIPTISWALNFSKKAEQTIEFGRNLRDYVRTVNAADLATALIPLGASNSSTGERLTVADKNGGKDYIYDETAVALRGWIFKTAVWEDVTLPENLLTKAQKHLTEVVKQNITIELNALDLHLLDRSIESFGVGENVRVLSLPHGLDTTMLCSKQTINLLKPEMDTITLGYHLACFTDTSQTMAAAVNTMGKRVSSIKQDAECIKLSVQDLDADLNAKMDMVVGDVAEIRLVVDSKDEEDLDQWAEIELLAGDIAAIELRVSDMEGSGSSIGLLEDKIEAIVQNVGKDGEVTAASIVAAINDASSSVQISADHVTVTGFVTFDDLEEDGAVTIHGGNIKAGTISADFLEGETIEGVYIEGGRFYTEGEDIGGDPLGWSWVDIAGGYIDFSGDVSAYSADGAMFFEMSVNDRFVIKLGSYRQYIFTRYGIYFDNDGNESVIWEEE